MVKDERRSVGGSADSDVEMAPIGKLQLVRVVLHAVQDRTLGPPSAWPSLPPTYKTASSSEGSVLAAVSSSGPRARPVQQPVSGPCGAVHLGAAGAL